MRGRLRDDILGIGVSAFSYRYEEVTVKQLIWLSDALTTCIHVVIHINWCIPGIASPGH
jgi:hypothetical protein